MEICSLQKDGLADCVKKAAAVLRAGGVILYPTDTLYGVGADAFSDQGFERVCAIKERDERRPIHAVFSDLTMVEKYAYVSDAGLTLAKKFLPGPLTIIFDKKEGIETGIARRLSTIGVRIPKSEFCLALAREFGKPFTTTSANKSGEEPVGTVEDILDQLGPNASLIDLVIDGGPLSPTMRSTIVDVRSGGPLILRDGAISVAEIREALAGVR